MDILQDVLQVTLKVGQSFILFLFVCFVLFSFAFFFTKCSSLDVVYVIFICLLALMLFFGFWTGYKLYCSCLSVRYLISFHSPLGYDDARIFWIVI